MTDTEFEYKLMSLQEPLMKLAYRLTSDLEDAKDLSQETLLKALKYCDKFVTESNFQGWIYTIMRNTFINNYHSTKRKMSLYDHSKSLQQQNEIRASGYNDPFSAYYTKELLKMIDSLEHDLKQPFKMHQEGFKYKEIAAALSVNIGTVKNRIFIARRKLIRQLD